MTPAVSPEFVAWVARVKDDYGTYGKLADSLELTESGFLRGVKNGTLRVETLLRLAKLTGVDPADVLRFAGKHELADILLHLYGRVKAPSLNKQERHILDLWREVKHDKTLSAALLVTLEAYVLVHTHRKKSSRDASGVGPLPSTGGSSSARDRGPRPLRAPTRRSLAP